MAAQLSGPSLLVAEQPAQLQPTVAMPAGSMANPGPVDAQLQQPAAAQGLQPAGGLLALGQPQPLQPAVPLAAAPAGISLSSPLSPNDLAVRATARPLARFFAFPQILLPPHLTACSHRQATRLPAHCSTCGLSQACLLSGRRST